MLEYEFKDRIPIMLVHAAFLALKTADNPTFAEAQRIVDDVIDQTHFSPSF